MPSGLRRGELAGLKWEDFDFGKLHVSVTRSLVDQRVGPVKKFRTESAQAIENNWRPRRDLNPCYRRERAQTNSKTL